METFRFHLLSGRRPATWRPGASALPPDRRTRLGWRPAAVAAVPPPGEGLRWPPPETPLSLRRSSCCPTVYSRAGCRFSCSAVRKPSSLGAKNPKPPVITCRLARPTTSDDRPRPLRAPRGALTMEAVELGALTPLQAARLDKGWKAARLAAELGVSETTLSRWEHGRQQPTLGHQ